MSNVMNLKILVSGFFNENDFSNKIMRNKYESWNQIINNLRTCKYLFYSSLTNLNPLILIDSLSSNIPIS